MNKEALRKELQQMKTMLRTKNLTTFWVMVDRPDFKPIHMSDKEFQKHVEKNVPHFRNQRLATIMIHVNPKSVDAVPPSYAYSITVIIMELDANAKPQNTKETNYGVTVHFYPEDVTQVQFSKKLVESILRMVARPHPERTQHNIFTGESFSAFKERYQRAGIPWEQA